MLWSKSFDKPKNMLIRNDKGSQTVSRRRSFVPFLVYLAWTVQLRFLPQKKERRMGSSAAADKSIPEEIASPSSSSSSSVDICKNRIIIPTLLAGIGGGGVGLISKHRKVHGLARMSSTYAANFAIVTACYCGAREFVRVNRIGKPDDLFNSAIGGFGSGAVLGRLQGGPVAAARYSIIFAVVGTTVDYATLKLIPVVRNFYNSVVGDGDKLKLPEWSPIQVLDEEALAAKRAREEQIYRSVHNLKKEET